MVLGNKMQDHVTLKLPRALDDLVLDIYVAEDLGIVMFEQFEPKFVDGKW